MATGRSQLRVPQLFSKHTKIGNKAFKHKMSSQQELQRSLLPN